jgi:quercetin dioxygenase-like cupin family protein
VFHRLGDSPINTTQSFHHVKQGINRLFHGLKIPPVPTGRESETDTTPAGERRGMKRTAVESERWFDTLLETDSARAAVMTLEAGRATGGPDNYHAESDQWLYVVDGSGWAVVDGERVDLAAGDLVCIEAGERHEVGASDGEALDTLNLYVPPR